MGILPLLLARAVHGTLRTALFKNGFADPGKDLRGRMNRVGAQVVNVRPRALQR